MLYDEFFTREIRAGRIRAEQFTDQPLKIMLHGHCHQKSLASVEPSREMLSLPVNYSVGGYSFRMLWDGGSFRVREKHYELSMKIGEQVLFPAVRVLGRMFVFQPGNELPTTNKRWYGETGIASDRSFVRGIEMYEGKITSNFVLLSFDVKY